MTTELLTWDEIERRYDGEWVLLGDIQYDPEDPGVTEILRARVLDHAREDRDQFSNRIKGRTPRSFGVYFVGEDRDDDLICIL